MSVAVGAGNEQPGRAVLELFPADPCAIPQSIEDVHAQIRLLSAPELRLVDTRWLAETVSATLTDVMTVPAEERSARLRTRPQSASFHLSCSREPPSSEPDESSSLLAAKLAATLHDVLGAEAKAIRIRASSVDYRFPMNTVRISAAPAEIKLPLNVTPVRAGDPDILIPAGMRMAIQGKDGSWLSIEPIAFSDGAFGASLPLSPLLAGGLIIALASTLLARRLTAPLDRLVIAARQIGTARGPVRVETQGMHEFAAVARAFEDMQQRLLNQRTDIASLLISLVDETVDTGHLCSYAGPDHAETVGHPVSLKRAFRNIIDNAINYGKTARVSLNLKTAAMTINIDDDGPGIPAASMEDVFAPFRRLDPARGHEHPGAGLGLTIARDVIQSHGGTVTLENRSEGGLRVLMELPGRCESRWPEVARVNKPTGRLAARLASLS
jgi:signal transduction histidine kinase